MRLAQAARKIGITTEDIVSYLEKKEISIVKDSNTKLDNDALELIYNYFGRPEETQETSSIEEIPVAEDQIVEADADLENAIELTVSNSSKAVDPKEVSNDKSSAEITEESIMDNGIDSKISEAEESLTSSIENTSSTSEKKYKTVSDLLAEQEQSQIDKNTEEEEIIIKAPKVNLKGLQVLGKIDLPEKPLKKPEQQEAYKEDKQVKTKRFERNKQQKRRQHTRKRRELSPQEIRDRERKIAEKKLKAEEAAKKKQREEYYTENILKPKQKLQKKKQAKKKLNKPQLAENKTPTQAAPKTIMGKFWKWLNT